MKNRNFVNPAIVVVTYNRFDSFKRLINSILIAKYTAKNIPLIISIDYHDDNISTIEYANEIQWNYGKKIIITHEQNLGLRNHIIKCGNLVNDYENIILLEDDLFLSPYFYQFCLASVGFYQNDDNIAGVSLYSYEKTESNLKDFKPFYNKYDTYFMQFPSSWGQLWTKLQWNQFISWYNINKITNNFEKLLPRYISAWPETSWKKYFAAYMLENDKYFVYPKIGLTTNFGEIGQNYPANTDIIQTNILSHNFDFDLEQFSLSSIKYDITFELTYNSLVLLNSKLNQYPKFTIDLHNIKDLKDTDLVLTQLKSSKPIRSFSNKMKPLINNLIYEIEGDGIVLTKAKDIIEEKEKEKEKEKRTFKIILKSNFFNLLKIIYRKIRYNINYDSK